MFQERPSNPITYDAEPTGLEVWEQLVFPSLGNGEGNPAQ